MSLTQARYGGAVLQLGPDAWYGIDALAELWEHGTEVRRADDRFDISLANGRTFEVSSERLFGAASRTLHQRFIVEEYRALEVAGQVVLDIGANIGDSAIYFADRSALHVYAFEPFSELYTTAAGVVRRNRLEHLVTVIPRGVGAQDGHGSGTYNSSLSVLSLASLRRPTAARLAGTASNQTEEFEIVSLPSVLRHASKRYPDSPLAIKMDCEGCEFEAFEAEGVSESLNAVKSIMLEVHPGDCHPRDEIWRRLEEWGFLVEELVTPARRHGASLLLATRGGDWEGPADGKLSSG